MTIYTSYFAKFRPEGTTPKAFSIANTSPKGWKGEGTIKELTPQKLVWDLKDKIINKDGYRTRYFVKLEKLDDDGYDWFQLNNKILVCWEKEGFCHRFILAEFLREKGFKVEEL
jgi:hypothetical protein